MKKKNIKCKRGANRKRKSVFLTLFSHLFFFTFDFCCCCVLLILSIFLTISCYNRHWCRQHHRYSIYFLFFYRIFDVFQVRVPSSTFHFSAILLTLLLCVCVRSMVGLFSVLLLLLLLLYEFSHFLFLLYSMIFIWASACLSICLKEKLLL